MTKPQTRRAAVAGLALAPAAALPFVTIAQAATRDDPILIACAELAEMRRVEEIAVAAFESADDAYALQAPAGRYLEIETGARFFTLDEFDESPYGQALDRSSYCRELRGKLAEIIAKNERARQASGIDEAAEAYAVAGRRCMEREDAILAIVPSSPAGAAALIRVAAAVIDERRAAVLPLALAALEAAAAFLEGRPA